MNTGVGENAELARRAREFEREPIRELLPEVRAQQERVREEFPLARWPDLPLVQYALGLNGSQGTFCRLLEYGTDALGSIRGGSAAKHIIYRHNSGQWRYPSRLRHLDHHGAWGVIRSEFDEALRLAGARDYRGIDDLEVLAFGPALVTKALSIYFPDDYLPIFSASHVRHFAALLGAPELLKASSVRTWRANRVLYDLIRRSRLFEGWHPHEVMHFLYAEYDPRIVDGDVWKIAPGDGARFWDDCRENGHICVAWDEVGDLGQYESDRELKYTLDRTRPDPRGGNLRLARHLLGFRDLEAGEQIIANNGKSEVLALGTVTGGYTYDHSRPMFRHLVAVDWDTSYAQHLDAPVQAWQQTFAKVPDRLLRQIRAARTPGREPAGPQRPTTDRPACTPIAEAPAAVRQIVDALEHKGQVILQGPPGTGKTRLALSTALALAGRADLIDADPAERAAALAELLTVSDKGEPGRLTMVTFHASYGYEDFVEGFKPDPDPKGAGLRLELRTGLFRRVCEAAAAAPEETFLLVIDEINRGDLPRILGELITLLELDKRGIPLTLPISGKQQAVPKNVRIIGTMNTADRSIGHLDAAIRRRFATIDVPPDLEAVDGEVGGLDLAEFLQSLNARLYRAFGPDQVIGQAALLRDDRPLATAEELATAFRHDIVPLVDDHCLGRPELLQEILGTLVDPATGRIAWSSPADLPQLLATEFTGADPDDNLDD
ncbi:AAA family ATPase [Kitasatospora sp. NPDC056783]|uniref:AAA family ATPase n=1 Tax=Kitasatospora sp. NPDC056783 TaxID=3345943 RepID=UPI0036961E1C